MILQLHAGGKISVENHVVSWYMGETVPKKLVFLALEQAVGCHFDKAEIGTEKFNAAHIWQIFHSVMETFNTIYDRLNVFLEAKIHQQDNKLHL